MRVTHRWTLIALAIAALVVLAACGGAGPAPEVSEEVTVEPPATGVEPPIVSDVDIEPGKLKVGTSSVDKDSGINNYEITPLVIGPLTNLSVTDGGSPYGVDSVTITQSADSTKKLELNPTSANSGGLKAKEGGTEHAIKAYTDTATYGCFKMADDLAAYFASGNSVDYVMDGTTNNMNLSGSNKIEFNVTKAVNPCPPGS